MHVALCIDKVPNEGNILTIFKHSTNTDYVYAKNNNCCYGFIIVYHVT